jgi:hypothetical protein
MNNLNYMIPSKEINEFTEDIGPLPSLENMDS